MSIKLDVFSAAAGCTFHKQFEVGKEYTTKSGSGSKIRVLMRDTHYEKPVIIEHIEGKYAQAEFGGANEILRVHEDSVKFWEEVKPVRQYKWTHADRHGRHIAQGYYASSLPPPAITTCLLSDRCSYLPLGLMLEPGDSLSWEEA